MITQVKKDVFQSLVRKHFGELVGERADAFGAMWFDRVSAFSVHQNFIHTFNDPAVYALRALRECMKFNHVEMSVFHLQLILDDFDEIAEFKQR